MKISSLINTINKFATLVKLASNSLEKETMGIIHIPFGREFMLKETIRIPSSKEGQFYYLNPGTALKIVDYTSDGTPKWSVSGWYSERIFNLSEEDKLKLLDLRSFFSEAASLLKGGKFFPPESNNIKVFKIINDENLEIFISFDPELNIETYGLEEDQYLSPSQTYKEEQSKNDPNKKFKSLRKEAIRAFSSPLAFLRFCGVPIKLDVLGDDPSILEEEQED
jgi:hypothetical protein